MSMKFCFHSKVPKVREYPDTIKPKTNEHVHSPKSDVMICGQSCYRNKKKYESEQSTVF